MNNDWSDSEAAQSARDLVAGLHEVELKCVTEWAHGRDSGEILGKIFTALRKRYPEEYRQAYKDGLPKKPGCKDCGDRSLRARRYCYRCYDRHRKAGDFG